MSIRTFLSIAAVVAFIFGLGFVLFPAALTSLYGVSLDPVGIFIAQLEGASLLALGIINWTSRDARDPSGILLGNFVANAVGFIVSLFAQLNQVGGINPLGWTTVVLYLFLAVGFGYFRFIAQGTLSRVTR
ncbi:MAG: hypothetical protein EHM21_08130 [Chloroflexi bacterium]|nr:MAG: hypothetical protein EHM21_08130 [Chloroflexota bacterium]